MGFRTIVIINNDRLNEIEDPTLSRAVHGWFSRNPHERWQGPYHVVEQCHADQVSLLLVDSLQAECLAAGMSWTRPDDALKLRVLKDAADKLGYRLVKRAKRHSPIRVNLV